MKTLSRNDVVLAGGLSAMAGFVDAVGYLQLRGAFVSFMSGNSTLFAVGLARGNMAGVALLGSILGLFVAGVMLGTFLAGAGSGRWQIPAVLAGVSGLLTCAALAFHLNAPLVAVAAMTLAMGAANATFQRDGDVVVGVTYMTGTLVKFGQKLAAALTGGPPWDWAPYLWLWTGLIAGGWIGARAFGAMGLAAVNLAVGWSLILTIYAGLSVARGPKA